jgi:hypothetical protein
LANQASKPGGTAPTVDGTGISRAQIASSKPPSVSASNGREPSKHSQAITPSDHRSERPSMFLTPSACSGLM